MAQFKTNVNSKLPTATNTAGVKIVTFDLGFLTDNGILSGMKFKYKGENTIYEIDTVDSQQQVTMIETITDAHTAAAFIIGTDFTSPSKLYRPIGGDEEWGVFLSEDFDFLDTIAAAAGGADNDHTEEGGNQTLNNIFVSGGLEVLDSAGGNTFRSTVTASADTTNSFIHVLVRLEPHCLNSAVDQQYLIYLKYTVNGGGLTTLRQWRLPHGVHPVTYGLDFANTLPFTADEILTGLTANAAYEFRLTIEQTNGSTTTDDVELREPYAIESATNYANVDVLSVAIYH